MKTAAEKAKEYQRKWREANPERVRESRKSWRKNNPEKVRESQRKDYERRVPNPGAVSKWRKDNPGYFSEKSRAWAVANPEKALARASHYRATRLNATPAWFEKEAIELLYLDSTTNPIASHVDHIIPLQSKLVCGLHCLANLAVIPAQDNRIKHNSFDQDLESAKQLKIVKELFLQ